MMRTITYIKIGLIFLFCMAFDAEAEYKDVTEDILTVYQKDGIISTMLKTEVDSMRLSKIDIDNLNHDIFVTQEIFTKDSTYRFDLALIDSISFQPFPTQFAEGVVVMDNLADNSFRKYVMGSNYDFTHLYVKSDIPKQYLPELGVTLFTDNMDKVLPNGFVGKVVSVDFVDDYYDIACENIALDDVFLSYCKVWQDEIENGDVYIEQENYEDLGTRAVSIKDELIWKNEQFEFPKFNTVFTEETLDIDVGSVESSFLLNQPQIDDIIKPIGSERIPFETFAEGGVSINTISNINVFFSKVNNIPFQIKVKMDNSHELDLSIGVKGHVEAGPLELETKEIPINYSIPLVRPNIQFGLKAKFEGDMGINLGSTIKFRTHSELTFLPVPIPMFPPVLTMQVKESPEVESDVKLFGNAKLEFGVYMKLNLDVIDKSLLRFSVVGEFGVVTKMNADFDLNELNNGRDSDNLYKKLTTPDCLTAAIYTGVSGLVTINPKFENKLLSLGKTFEDVELGKITYTFDPFFSRPLIGKMKVTTSNEIEEGLWYSNAFPSTYCNFDKGMEGLLSILGLDCKFFFSINDLTDPLHSDNIQTVEIDHLLGEKEYNNESLSLFWLLNSWGLENWRIDDYLLYPLHSYEVNPYLVLMQYQKDEDGNHVYDADGNNIIKYFPIKTDISLKFELPKQPSISASYSYPFRSNGALMHMVNLHCPTPDLSEFKGLDKWGVYVKRSSRSDNQTSSKVMDIQGYPVYIDGPLWTPQTLLPENEEYDSEVDLAFYTSDFHVINDMDVEFDVNFDIGYYVYKGSENQIISAQNISLKREYAIYDYEGKAEWTPNYDKNGNLTSYDGNFSLLIKTPIFMNIYDNSDSYSIDFSDDVLKYNSLLKDTKNVRNYPVSIKQTQRVSPTGYHTISGQVYFPETYNWYWKDYEFRFIPTNPSPVFRLLDGSE